MVSKRYTRILVWALLAAGAAGVLSGAHGDETASSSTGGAVVLRVSDAIGPATADYISRGLETARERQAGLVVLELDTPGGLDTAMRTIIRDIIASPVPVAVYVSPAGARAASAGTYMMYASHVAAMAPGTNLGAATPVQIGGLPGIDPGDSKPATPPGAADGEPEPADAESGAPENGNADATEAGDEPAEEAGEPEPAPAHGGSDAMTRKMVNDAVAYIRSLAEMRGRNADWAEQAVREAASLSSEQALARGVIDIVAPDITDLLKQIDGTVVNVLGQERTLATENMTLDRVEPDWRNELLSVITNPNIAYILMLLGIYGLFFELANPGYVLPGVIGAICLLLALYAMQVLPVNYAGLGLILLGIMFMVGELFMPSFGALGIGGVVAFVVGSIILFDKDSGNIAVSLPLIAAVAVLSAGFFLVAIRVVFAAHRGPVVSGSEQLVGGLGVVVDDFQGRGRVRIHGETWQAESPVAVKGGARVRVVSRDGLVLKIEPAEEDE